MTQTTPATIGANQGYEGQIITTSIRNIKGAYGQYINAEATPLNIGRLIVQGTNSREGKLPSSASQKPLGILISHAAIGKPLLDAMAGNPMVYQPKQALNILSIGEVLVYTEEAVNFNDPVFYRYAGAGNKGQFRKSLVASETAQLPNTKFISATSGAGLAAISIFGWMF